jgi:hypothetical protein
MSPKLILLTLLCFTAINFTYAVDDEIVTFLAEARDYSDESGDSNLTFEQIVLSKG